MGCNGMAFFPSNFMVQNPHDQEDHHHHHHHPPTSLNSIIPSSCTPHHQVDLHGVASLLAGKRSMSFSGFDVGEEANVEDDYSDDGSQVGEKKRRLNMEQVRTLEKSFELGNKLEPERKMQLARALGLQPRQIAIWFQNRRARWKTKQLEKDYDLLKRQFEAIKADNDALQALNKKLHAEILALKSRSEPAGHEYIINLNKETDQQGSSSNRSENSSEINLDISRRSTPPSIDSPPLSSPHQSRPPHTTTLFSSSNLIRPTAVAQLLQNSSRLSSDFQQQQFLQNKMEPTTLVQDDQNFTNMFCGIDDQPNFWPWPEQQQFH